MANWGKLSNRGTVDDRRMLGPVAFGGISLAGVALTLLFTLLSGGSVTDVLGQLDDIPVESTRNIGATEFEGQDEYEVFASTVLGSNNEMWESVFARMKKNYSPPRLVLFRTATGSACGNASSEIGPHYCPVDGTIYLDETFFDELTRRYGAHGGDVAEAYVIAHEVAHHAQNELGIMDQIHNAGSDNSSSVKLELQADCFAGLWAHTIKDLGVFEKGEIHEAIDAAAAVGDDRIQQRATGRINPETWTHGSSQQRVEWFNRGYDSGQLSACDTFR